MNCVLGIFVSLIMSSAGVLAQAEPSSLPLPVEKLFPKGNNEVIVQVDYGADVYVVIENTYGPTGTLVLYRYDSLNGNAYIVKRSQSLFPFDDSDPASPPVAVRQALARAFAEHTISHYKGGAYGAAEYYRNNPRDWAMLPDDLKSAYQTLGVAP